VHDPDLTAVAADQIAARLLLRVALELRLALWPDPVALGLSQVLPASSRAGHDRLQAVLHHQQFETQRHRCLSGPGLFRLFARPDRPQSGTDRSEEHTSELQSRFDLVCRLLLEKK